MLSYVEHRQQGTFVLAVLLSVLLIAALPVAARAAEKGVQTDLTWGISSADQDRTMAGVVDLGARWHRLTMAWHDIETRKGSYSLSHYDDAITKAAASGVNLVVSVYTAPKWASGTDQRESPPLNPADYADFMAFVADRYRGRVHAWEVWNEQNTPTFWTTGPDPARYARLLKAAYPAVKGADPNALVVYGGTWQNDYAFLEGAYAEVADLGDYFDVLGTHPYNGVSAPEQVDLAADGRIAPWSFAGYRELRRTMLAHGDDKPIWFTEFGWATFDGAWGVSEATQADFVARAFRCVEQDPYVNVAILYAFRNHPHGADGQTWQHQLGLTRTDFSTKPAYDTFKRYTPGSGGCTYEPVDARAAAPAPAAPDPLPSVPAAPDPGQLPDTRVAGPVEPRDGRAAPMLAVRGAQVRAGRLLVQARVARDASGLIHGIAAYGGVQRAFNARVERDGSIRIDAPLPARTGPGVVWVALSYMGDTRFRRQWVILQAGALRPRLRLERDATASATTDSWNVAGGINPLARGRVALVLEYRTADGRAHTLVARARIRGGRFFRSFAIPDGARDAVVHVVFPGDPLRGIGGGSATITPATFR